MCETCAMAKIHHATFHLSDNRADLPFSLVHSDVWVPVPLSTHNGIKWFVTFVDDCTRMTWVFHMKHKSDVCTVFRHFHQMVVTQFGISIKVLRFDNGSEYFKQQLMEFMHSVGVIIKQHALILLNKMVLQSEEISIYWKSLGLS